MIKCELGHGAVRPRAALEPQIYVFVCMPLFVYFVGYTLNLRCGNVENPASLPDRKVFQLLLGYFSL